MVNMIPYLLNSMFTLLFERVIPATLASNPHCAYAYSLGDVLAQLRTLSGALIRGETGGMSFIFGTILVQL